MNLCLLGISTQNHLKAPAHIGQLILGVNSDLSWGSDQNPYGWVLNSNDGHHPLTPRFGSHALLPYAIH